MALPTKETIMGSIKEKAAEVGHKIAETATTVGHQIAEGAEKATDWAKEKAGMGAEKSPCNAVQSACSGESMTAYIREHMEVVASCGMHVGVVDCVEGNAIKLTKSDPMSGGEHHFIPAEWVAAVDHSVHLNRNAKEVFLNWKAES
jgi:hypothetical protein